MLIDHDPDDTVVDASYSRCDFHRKHPGQQYAGCACNFSIRTRKATPDEYQAARRKRLAAKRDRLQAEIEAIDHELGKLG